MKHIAARLLGAMLFAGASAAAAGDIPVDKIILSTSGLAQFEHRAKVTGNAALEFPVRLEQVDDILKSLVIFDAKGRVGAVTLPGRQPLDQIFKDLPFDRGQLANAMMMLNAYQGAVVTIKEAKAESVTGKIIQVTPEEVVLENNKTVTKHRLNLMTGAGMKQAVLEDLQSLQFADARVRDEIARALDAIRDNSTSGKRVLTVNLLGKATRPVALAYVVEAPLWKAAYRMVAPEAGKTSGFLQGWAVVENMTAGDWNNVDLSLVSGNPVTFRQALYQSYYVKRPEMPVQVFGLVLPKMDQGTIASAAEMQQEKEAAMQQGGMRAKSLANAPAPMMMEMADSSEAASTGMAALAGGAGPVQSAEAATQVLFRFPERLSLKAGQSMMLPFVSRDVPMERVSLYQPGTNARHPLAAVEMKNDGETGLPPGVLTLYEESKLTNGAGFAGDAQLPELAPGEKRLISYALDSKTTIDRNDKSAATEGRFTAERGVLRVSVTSRAETTYTIKAPAKEGRMVIIEHPRSGDYKLVAPDPKTVEVTDTDYRIRVAVKAGETRVLPVVLESQLWQSYNIGDLPVEQLTAYAAGQGGLSPEAQKLFEEVAGLRRALDETDRKMAAAEEERQVIFQDQARVRENLKSIGVKSDVQQKYLDKLNAQEDQVARLDKQKHDLSEQRRMQLSALQDKIAGMNF
jgi:hypothetical protein